jgi:hypothetical protein
MLFVLEDGGSTFLRNVGNLLQGYTASHPTKYYFEKPMDATYPIFTNSQIIFTRVLSRA